MDDNANRITFFRVTYNNNHGRFGIPFPLEEPRNTGILPDIRRLLEGNNNRLNRKRRYSDNEINNVGSDRLICRQYEQQK